MKNFSNGMILHFIKIHFKGFDNWNPSTNLSRQRSYHPSWRRQLFFIYKLVRDKENLRMKINFFENERKIFSTSALLRIIKDNPKTTDVFVLVLCIWLVESKWIWNFRFHYKKLEKKVLSKEFLGWLYKCPGTKWFYVPFRCQRCFKLFQQTLNCQQNMG